MAISAIPTLLNAPPNWKDAISASANELGWDYFCKDRELLLWHPGSVKSAGNYLWTDSVSVRRFGAGPDKLVVRLLNHRVYFNSEDVSTPLQASELELFGTSTAPKKNQDVVFGKVAKLFIDLQSLVGFSDVTPSRNPTASLLTGLTMRGGSGSSFGYSTNPWVDIEKYKFHALPPDCHLNFCYDEAYARGRDVTDTYRSQIIRQWQRASGGGSLETRIFALGKLLDKLERSPPSEPRASDVYFLPVTGQKGTPLPNTVAKAMHIFDRIGQRYCLYSYDNKALNYSASNQLQSAIQLVGSAPYKLEIQRPEKSEGLIYLGLDIGHDRRLRKSSAVCSIIDQHGLHIGSSKVQLELNESLTAIDVVQLIQTAYRYAAPKLTYTPKCALIIRDGKLPDGNKNRAEKTQNYIDALEVPASLVELRKRGNPVLMSSKTEPQFTAASPGEYFIPTSQDYALFTAYDTKGTGGIANTFKLTIPRGGDTLNWGLLALSKIVAGLCYSPSLGLKPHLPAPIYWADGIAKTSPTDNRFRGQNVINL